MYSTMFLFGSALFVTFGADRSGSKRVAETLALHEEAMVRSAAYRGLPTRLYRDAKGFFKREVSLDKYLLRLYADKPRAMLPLLRDIVKGANPRDAICAAGMAIALSEDPTTALMCVGLPEEGFDDRDLGKGKTLRQKLLQRLEANLRATEDAKERTLKEKEKP